MTPNVDIQLNETPQLTLQSPTLVRLSFSALGLMVVGHFGHKSRHFIHLAEILVRRYETMRIQDSC